MNKTLMAAFVSASLLLSGCATTNKLGTQAGVAPVNIPALSENLTRRATRLPDITDTTMGGREMAGVQSDKQYNDLAFRYNAILDIYQCVRLTINNNKDPKTCLK